MTNSWTGRLKSKKFGPYVGGGVALEVLQRRALGWNVDVFAGFKAAQLLAEFSYRRGS